MIENLTIPTYIANETIKQTVYIFVQNRNLDMAIWGGLFIVGAIITFYICKKIVEKGGNNDENNTTEDIGLNEKKED